MNVERNRKIAIKLNELYVALNDQAGEYSDEQIEQIQLDLADAVTFGLASEVNDMVENAEEYAEMMQEMGELMGVVEGDPEDLSSVQQAQEEAGEMNDTLENQIIDDMKDDLRDKLGGIGDAMEDKFAKENKEMLSKLGAKGAKRAARAAGNLVVTAGQSLTWLASLYQANSMLDKAEAVNAKYNAMMAEVKRQEQVLMYNEKALDQMRARERMEAREVTSLGHQAGVQR